MVESLRNMIIFPDGYDFEQSCRYRQSKTKLPSAISSLVVTSWQGWLDVGKREAGYGAETRRILALRRPGARILDFHLGGLKVLDS